MSRLYYEPENNGPGIRLSLGPGTSRVIGTVIARTIGWSKHYDMAQTPQGETPTKEEPSAGITIHPKEIAEKISKLIPVEIIAGYSTLVGFCVYMPGPLVKTVAIAISFLAGLIFTPVYLSKMADEKKPKTRHLVISTVAFPFWAYLTSGAVVIPTLYSAAAAGFGVTLFSLVTAWIPLDP